MRILYIHQYFCTRAGRSGTRSYEFARFLVRQGHRVTMLTSDSDLSDIEIPPGQKVSRFDVEGIDVVAVRVPYSQQLGALGRIQSFLRFMALSSWIACKLERHDVVIATSTPLTVGVPGVFVKLLRRVPLVFEVRDLWPQAPIEMGVIRSPLLIALLRAFERFVYRQSTFVIALSPGMRDGVLAAGTAASKVVVIPNCSDLDLFCPGDPSPELIDRHGLRARFVVGYAGSLGEANDVDVLLDAASRLRDRREIRFVLVGQGKQAAGLTKRVHSLELENVQFAGSMPRRDVAAMLRVFDVCLVLFKNLPVLATNSPNKLFDALAAGRPVLVNSDGWTRQLVEDHRVGRYAEPGSGRSLAREIVWLCDNTAARVEMGRNARGLAEAEFDRLKLAAEFERVLRRAAGEVVHERPVPPDPPVASPPASLPHQPVPSVRAFEAGSEATRIETEPLGVGAKQS